MSYVSNRVLKINVGFLLADGPGHSHETAFDVPQVRVSDDLTLDYVRGPLRLSRTKEGVLVQGKLETGIGGECYRCLEPVTENVTVEIEELYVYPPRMDAEFVVEETAVLNVGPLLRDEVIIATARGLLCQPDCRGLCPTCGTNLNQASCDCDTSAADPRLATLRNLLK
ncbi:MAG TPA: DUF177 domain-containing protein [Phototrophicaceae bacterium]|nr:DUF177 domain-containing protein [Phototrophicaceae bacterium]